MHFDSYTCNIALYLKRMNDLSKSVANKKDEDKQDTINR